MNNYELTEEERRPLLDICDKWLDYEIVDFINSILLDRYNKWKEEAAQESYEEYRRNLQKPYGKWISDNLINKILTPNQ